MSKYITDHINFFLILKKKILMKKTLMKKIKKTNKISNKHSQKHKEKLKKEARKRFQNFSEGKTDKKHQYVCE